MPRRTDISIQIVAVALLGAASAAHAMPPPEPVDWAADLPAGAWVLGQHPWQDRAPCAPAACQAGLNATPYLIGVRYSVSQSSPWQISFHGSVVGCASTFQRALADGDLYSPEMQVRFQDMLSQFAASMREGCAVPQAPLVPPLPLSRLIPVTQ